MTPEQEEQRAEMQQAMREAQQSAERSLAKIIGTAAFNRLRQIQYQRQGPSLLLQPEWIEKFNLDEEQVPQIRELLTEGRRAQGQVRRQQFDMMKGASRPRRLAMAGRTVAARTRITAEVEGEEDRISGIRLSRMP